jgi:hypothetical protein
MTTREEKVFEYRQRAEELRVIADQTENPETRQRLRDVADGYERMAENLPQPPPTGPEGAK